MAPMPETPRVQYDRLKVSKPGIIMTLSEINYGHWLEQDEAIRPCSNNTTFKGKPQFDIYVFISLTHGPEYHPSHPSQIAVVVARQLGATPNIRGCKLKEKRSFGEINNADKFMASLSGVVRVEKNPRAELSNGRIQIVRVPNRVSEEYIPSEIKPIFQSKRNIKIVTYFNSSAKMKGQVNHQPNAYQCLAVFESLKLQLGLQELADSMVQ
ncbi:hypothetical protein PHJA_001322500 [Phtheirospermum japonicum]|uniref:Uncharacterized protein n=1 Tax=Phtheirospermum japonicum TaxID=374723 RepID=A0A830C998_9LAMI|nr:hypothetical protein PHJA_001322500 [Phtheirospermum japonicum]